MFIELLGMIHGISIPLPVTLVCACACAYLIGKIPDDLQNRNGSSKADRKNSRGKKLVDRLAQELNLLREDLELHDQSVQQLLDAITRVEHGENLPINDQAKQTLRSIQKYATEFQQNFDSIQASTATAVNTLTSDAVQTKDIVAEDGVIGLTAQAAMTSAALR